MLNRPKRGNFVSSALVIIVAGRKTSSQPASQYFITHLIRKAQGYIYQFGGRYNIDAAPRSSDNPDQTIRPCDT